MGLSTPEKSAKRRQLLEKEALGNPFGEEAIPLILQAFDLWDSVRSTNEPWSLNDIERFIKQCAEIKIPMDEFRKKYWIASDEGTYKNVIIFTNRWHLDYCSEAAKRLISDLRKILDRVGADAKQLTIEVRRYHGANIDSFEEQRGRHEDYRKRLFLLMEEYKKIEEANALIQQTVGESTDVVSTYQSAITPAVSAVRELKDDLAKQASFSSSHSSNVIENSPGASIVDRSVVGGHSGGNTTSKARGEGLFKQIVVGVMITVIGGGIIWILGWNDQLGTPATDGAETSNQIRTIEGFYGALAKGNGSEAVQFIVPEKRETGHYSAAGLSSYWQYVDRPLRLKAKSQLGPSVWIVSYSYQRKNEASCDDNAKVYLLQRERNWYIDAILPEEGC